MSPTDGVPRDLLLAWAAGRSLSRGLPAPVVEGEAIRVDTGSASETRRYIFAAPTPAITALAATIAAPRILLKVCAPLADLMAQLPPWWRAHPQAYFMSLSGAMRTSAQLLPAGYTLAVGPDGAAQAARITAADGTVAARGRVVRSGGLTVYDQIATDPAHQRRGLGSHIMHALAAAFDDTPRDQALTATAAGQALYAALGWTTVAPYSTGEHDGDMRVPPRGN